MSRFLMIDIGAGTLDLLCYDTGSGDYCKAVGPSPVRLLGEQVDATAGPLVVSGVEMGGGPVTEALRRRAQVAEVLMTASAAATLHHDLLRVQGWGIRIVDPEQARRLAEDARYTPIRLGDVQPGRIARIVEGLGWPMDFEAVALCAQDHGLAPTGVSHLDFRHKLFEQMLERQPCAHRLLFAGAEVPEQFHRLRAMASDAAALNAREVYVMDSGMAAMVGAAQDAQALGRSPLVVLDVATSHTVAAALEQDRLAGFVEYHTRDLTRQRLEALVSDLAEGRLVHEQVVAAGGHGAYLRKAVGLSNVRAIIATGPKRRLLTGTRLPIHWGAPWGDNMMTGTVGLLESLRRRKGLAPIAYA